MRTTFRSVEVYGYLFAPLGYKIIYYCELNEGVKCTRIILYRLLKIIAFYTIVSQIIVEVDVTFLF